MSGVISYDDAKVPRAMNYGEAYQVRVGEGAHSRSEQEGGWRQL